MASVLRLFFILLLILVCLVLAAGVWSIERVPGMAAQRFGPPSPSLSTPQRVMYSFRLLNSERSLVSPLDAQGRPREFTVSLGESVNSIATRLEEERFIANADTLRTYLIYSGFDTRVQAGTFQLSPAMNTLEIAAELQDPVPEEVTFNILAGWRVEEIANALPTSGIQVSPAEFLRVVRRPPDDILPRGVPAGTPLEGFLLPGSYQVKRETTAKELAAMFTARFDEQVTEEMRDGFANQGLNLVEAVKLASIVEREAVVSEEQGLIASVFYNRLAIGMKLDSDPTVQYAVGYQMASNTWWKNPLTRTDLRFDSRYNTYIYPGLPPGPICNPGLDVLQAVASPAQSGYYYFRAQCDLSGRHFFAVTYEEHLQNACP
jgi:UPF0755 protein